MQERRVIAIKRLRIANGAGYAGDRLDAGEILIKRGNIDYLTFECLAERTIGLCQREKLYDQSLGYSRLSEERLRRTLKLAKEYGVRIISNLGAANPSAAIYLIMRICKEQGIKGLKLAAVTGDDIFDQVKKYYNYDVLEFPGKLGDIHDKLISANAYCGIEGIVEALINGADIVITGRVADPALTLAPLCYEYGWNIINNPIQFGQGILAGHLIECGPQSTGGSFADPPYKAAVNLAHMGFPIVDFENNGDFIITKPEGTGGMVTLDTVKEQLLYEIHDPTAYMTPDAIADFSQARLKQIAVNQVLVTGATSHGRPEKLKVNLCYKDSFTCEGGVTYGGSSSLQRAQIAGNMFIERMKIMDIKAEEVRVDYIGYNSLYREKISRMICNENIVFPEIRLRVAARMNDYATAIRFSDEFDSMYGSGPFACGGVTMNINEIINVCSIFVDRSNIRPLINYWEV